MMKWYAIPALLAFGLNSMLAAIIVCLATFHLYTDKTTNAPIEPIREWIRYVKFLLPFAVCWMVISIGGMYVSMAKKRIICATWVSDETKLLSFYGICLGLSAYFTLVFSKQLEVKDVEADVLFKAAIDEIQEHRLDAWIPSWLDNIQKQSKHCCGINTYHDYEKLWATTPSRVPKSCCKELKTNQGPCPSDLTLIPFPKTPADFIKVEVGCTDEILASVRHHIQETYYNCITSSAVIGLGLCAFMVLFTKRYLFKEKKSLIENIGQKAIGGITSIAGGDAKDLENAKQYTGETLPITSSVALVDSMDGVQPFGSIVSMTGPNPEQYLLQQTSATMLAQIQQQQQLQQIQLEQLKQQQLLQQFQQQQIMQPSQLFHQQPQMMDAQILGASTGSFVFNNPGRREPFIAQSGMIPTASAAEESSGLNTRSMPPYPDNVTVTNRSEQQAEQQSLQAPTSPPGSPAGRYKKVRREALEKRRKDASK